MFLNEFYMDIIIETLTGTSMELRILPFATVLDVKEKIQHLEGIPVSQQSLVWRSMELENDYLLRDYNIHSGATLRLVLSMRGGPINTRRVPVAEEPPSLSEMVEYLGYEDPLSTDRLVIVYHSGDKLSFFRLVDRDTGSALSQSNSSAAECNPDEDYQAYKQRVEQNHRTRDTMAQLRSQMKSLALAKKHKRSLRKTMLSRPGSQIGSGLRAGSRLGSGVRPGSRACKRGSAVKHGRDTRGDFIDKSQSDLSEAAEDGSNAGTGTSQSPSLAEASATPQPDSAPSLLHSSKSMQESTARNKSKITAISFPVHLPLKPLNLVSLSEATAVTETPSMTATAASSQEATRHLANIAPMTTKAVTSDTNNIAPTHNTSTTRSSSFFNSTAPEAAADGCTKVDSKLNSLEAAALADADIVSPSVVIASESCFTQPTHVPSVSTSAACSMGTISRSLDPNSFDKDRQHMTDVTNLSKLPQTSRFSQDQKISPNLSTQFTSRSKSVQNKSGPLNFYTAKSGVNKTRTEVKHESDHDSKVSNDSALKESVARKYSRGKKKLAEIKTKRLYQNTSGQLPESVDNAKTQLKLHRSTENKLIDDEDLSLNRANTGYINEVSSMKPLPSISSDKTGRVCDRHDSASRRRENSLMGSDFQNPSSSRTALNTRRMLPPVSSTHNKPKPTSTDLTAERLQASDTARTASSRFNQTANDSNKCISLEKIGHCTRRRLSSVKPVTTFSCDDSSRRSTEHDLPHQCLNPSSDNNPSSNSSMCQHISSDLAITSDKISAPAHLADTLSRASEEKAETGSSICGTRASSSQQRLDGIVGGGASGSVRQDGIVRGGSGGSVTLESLNVVEAQAVTGVLNSLTRRGGVVKRTGYRSGTSVDPHGLASVSPTHQTSQTVLRILSGGSIRGGSRPGSALMYTLPPVRVNKKKISGKRCTVCGKKTTLTTDFVCRCGFNFCAQHRYAETHDCSYDYKTEGRKLLEQSNPVVSASKLPRI